MAEYGTPPKQCSALEKGDYVMLKERPCKIVELSTSEPGKHGNAKVTLVGVDIFTGDKYEDALPVTENMDVLQVTDYKIIDYLDGMVNIYNVNRDDLINLPEGDLGKKIKDGIDAGQSLSCSVVSALGEERIVDVKQNPGHR
ncbi:EIF5A [Branchiostoma lanceolatum]|uniref:Eukaryotic translation initiation factor 5A n=1 Tax=Branchiostoma lanceolatum TaxID=7740 RepID=A0A8J9ZWE8_BRALA|nr:EIF5A [Branchiostoma lanceolatum]